MDIEIRGLGDDRVGGRDIAGGFGLAIPGFVKDVARSAGSAAARAAAGTVGAKLQRKAAAGGRAAAPEPPEKKMPLAAKIALGVAGAIAAILGIKAIAGSGRRTSHP